MKTISIIDVENIYLIKEFDCGNRYLNEYFRRFALYNDITNIGRTFVFENQDCIVGFYTLATCHISFKDMSESYKNENPKYDVPAVKICRLGVNRSYQRNGIGRELIKDAIRRIVLSSYQIAVKAIVVDPKEESVEFYKKFPFKMLENGLMILHIETAKDLIGIESLDYHSKKTKRKLFDPHKMKYED